jgi:hypothetical protein
MNMQMKNRMLKGIQKKYNMYNNNIFAGYTGSNEISTGKVKVKKYNMYNFRFKILKFHKLRLLYLIKEYFFQN